MLKQIMIRARQSRGLYLVWFAIFLPVAIALFALVIDIGFLLTNSSRLRVVANLTSLAALEEFIEFERLYPGRDLSERPQAVRDRANEILQLNQLAATSSRLGGLELATDGEGEGGTIHLGAWYQELPAYGVPPCGADQGSYPCFNEGDPDTTNAMRIEIRNASTNPITTFFARVFGSDFMTVRAQATATMAPRCSAYLLDVSPSVAESTHRLTALPPLDSSNPGISVGFDYPDFINNAGAPPCRDDFFASPSPPYVDLNDNSDAGWFGDISTFDYLWDGPRVLVCPVDASLFAFRRHSLRQAASNRDIHLNYNCQGPSDFCEQCYYDGCGGPPLCTDRDWFDITADRRVRNIEGAVWCNIVSREGRVRNRKDFPGSPFLDDFSMHFIGDYYDLNSRHGPVRIDALIDPQPLTTFMNAFNAGIRLVESQATSSDRAFLMAFAGDERGRFPDTDPNSPTYDCDAGAGVPDTNCLFDSGGINAVTANFDMLVQLTNVNNRGKIDNSTPGAYDAGAQGVIYPNFIGRGMFPLYAASYDAISSETHLVSALNRTIDILQSACPASSKKSIILASDGIFTCADKSADGPGAIDCPRTRQDPEWTNTYRRAEQQLIRFNNFDNPGAVNTSDTSTILNRLNEARISLTALYTGAAVGPNIVNIPKPGGGFVDYSEAQASGNVFEFYDRSPVIPGDTTPTDKEAFERIGEVTAGGPVLFKRPTMVLGALAMYSGGYMCPLMPKCDGSNNSPGFNPMDGAVDCASQTGAAPGGSCPSGTNSCSNGCYQRNPDDPCGPCILKDAHRVPDQPITCSLEDLSMTEQAAKCVSQTLGSNPYILVEE
ncbi:MAG: hypothetical protein DCC75_04365 [Proteobacteria bacterium]|nr:MAG: hypothetical protein DCC75_04365 [Pseudomonadota bacterium]